MNTYYGDESKVNNNIYIFSFLIDEPFYSDLLIKIVTLANKYMTIKEYNSFLSDMKYSKFIAWDKKDLSFLKNKLIRWLDKRKDKIHGNLVVIKNVGNDHHNVIIDNINIIFPNEKDALIYDNMTGLSEKIKPNENLNVKFMRSKYDRKLQICDFLGRYVINKYNTGKRLNGVKYLKD